MKAGGRKRKKKRYRKLCRILKIQFLMQAVLICTLLYVKYGDSLINGIYTVKELYEEADFIVQGASERDFGMGRASTAYAEDGTVICEWRGSKNIEYIALSDMPGAVADAMICMEDRRFYKHHGVDYKALFRAVLALIKEGGEITQGGSTITMQLARNMYLTQEVSWQRKAEEIFIAWGLEKKFSKEKILEFYLNNIYFGNGYYGIGSAAYGYFGKDIKELDLSRLVYLCAIPNNPTIYNPVTGSGSINKRKELILKKMLDDGYITEDDYDTAVMDAVFPEFPEQEEQNNYTLTYASNCAVRALMELSGFAFCYDWQGQDEREKEAYKKEYEARYAACQKLLYTEGYQIYTSLDLMMQQTLQDSVDRELGAFTETNEDGIYVFQGAAVCIDNETGFIKAIVGGRSQDFDGYTLNRAYQSFRQPGSSIKPLIVYTPLFERSYTPDTTVLDEPIAGGPRNATGHYEGRVTLRYAVEQSLNTVAWNLFEELTPEAGLSYLTKMEFSKIAEEDYGPSAALGGFTIGVSPLEMASAFAAIENEGIFKRPTCVMRILDADGNTIYEADCFGKRVYEKQAADMMKDVLAGVMENGTGEPVKLNGIFCAGKTGTTNDCKDSWFVGFTKRYTTSVWVGYDMPREMEGLSGPAYSGFIWKDFMEEVCG